MAANTRQHFVPQAYLRGFADESGRALRAYNIDRRRHIDRASISGQCQLHRPFGKHEIIDVHLSHVERQGLVVLRRLRDDQELYDDAADHHHLIAYVLYQWARTQRAADVAAEYTTQHARAFFGASEGTSEALRSVLPQMRMQLPHPLAGPLHQAIRYVPVIGDLRPKLLLNETGVEFVTSDNPVVFHNVWRQTWPWSLNSTGLLCGGLQLFLPLSPRVALVQYDDDVYWLGHDGDHRVVVRDETTIREINALVMAYAGANLYYRDPAMRAEVDGMDWSRRAPIESLIVTHAPTRGHPRATRLDVKIAPVTITSRVWALRPWARAMPHVARVVQSRLHAAQVVAAIRAHEQTDGAGGAQ